MLARNARSSGRTVRSASRTVKSSGLRTPDRTVRSVSPSARIGSRIDPLRIGTAVPVPSSDRATTGQRRRANRPPIVTAARPMPIARTRRRVFRLGPISGPTTSATTARSRVQALAPSRAVPRRPT